MSIGDIHCKFCELSTYILLLPLHGKISLRFKICSLPADVLWGLFVYKIC